MPTTGIQTLRHLSDIITESLDTIEQVYAHAEMPLPSLDAPFDPADPAETVRQDPVARSAILNIMAATSQMSATLCNPAAAVVSTSMAFHISSCLRAASELDVADILREVGPEGLYVKDIAAPSKADPGLLARVLRLLATHNIFREVTPDVFANNRISSALDKGKPPGVLFEQREERLIGTSGIAAAVEFFSDDIFKSSAWLADTMLKPKDGVLPFKEAFHTEEPVFVYMQRPENAYRRLRLGIGMQGISQTESPDAIFTGFDWGALSAGSVLVDVGGGHGHVAMSIVQKNPNLRVVIQDFERTLDGAKILWKDSFPTHIENRMVEFQAHDLFDPQPLKNAAVFMMRFILHDWPDARCVKILQNLRDAAQPSTQLVIIERIIPFVASTPGSEGENIPGAQRPSAPPPLLPNWGVGMAAFYLYDFDVHTILGGVERTLDGFNDILSKARWKLDRVYHCVGSELSHIVGVPV